MAREASPKGIFFIARHESPGGVPVLNAYRDPVGIWTIGHGFTSLSRVVRSKLGKIRKGMKMTREEADSLLGEVVNKEFAPATERGMPDAAQHHFDMGCSGSFNVGARIFKWRWANHYRNGDVPLAAKKWRTTATTAQGVPLRGLRRRRGEEADLLLHGNYGKGTVASFKRTPKSKSKGDYELMEYQQKLATLGYYDGKVDGWLGPDTDKAVRKFQDDDPYLITDGTLGRATKESIDRKVSERKDKRTFSLSSAASTVGIASSYLSDMHEVILYATLGFVVVIATYFLIKYRKRLESKALELLS